MGQRCWKIVGIVLDFKKYTFGHHLINQLKMTTIKTHEYQKLALNG
jgi:hypothetical protein